MLGLCPHLRIFIFSVYVYIDQVCWGYVGAGTKQGCRFIHIANSGKYWQKLVFQYSEVFNIQDTDTNIGEILSDVLADPNQWRFS